MPVARSPLLPTGAPTPGGLPVGQRPPSWMPLNGGVRNSLPAATPGGIGYAPIAGAP